MKKWIGAAILLGGCVSQASMDATMDEWRGATLDEVISTWGVPDSERTVAGRTVYEWDWEHRTIGTYGTAGGQHTFNCTRAVEVDSSGRVVRANLSGNSCDSRVQHYVRS